MVVPTLSLLFSRYHHCSPRAVLLLLQAGYCLRKGGRNVSCRGLVFSRETVPPLLSLHSACLSSASLSFWLRVCEGGAAVTRLFLDSLTAAGVPAITHFITIQPSYYHSSFYVQRHISASLVASGTARCLLSGIPTPVGAPAERPTCLPCLGPPTDITTELTNRTS